MGSTLDPILVFYLSSPFLNLQSMIAFLCIFLEEELEYPLRMKGDAFLGSNVLFEQLICQTPCGYGGFNQGANVYCETVVIKTLKVSAGLGIFENRLNKGEQAFFPLDEVVEMGAVPAIVVQ